MKKLLMLSLVMIITMSESIAANTNKVMNANANLNSTCTLKVDNLDFGVWNLNSMPFQTHQVKVMCSNKVSYTIKGDTRNSSGLTLKSEGTTDSIGYGVFINPSWTWGNVFSPGYASINGIGDGSEKLHNIYFRAYDKTLSPTQKMVKPGVYKDFYQISLVY